MVVLPSKAAAAVAAALIVLNALEGLVPLDTIGLYADKEFAAAETKVCTDCGKCLTESATALTNMCALVSDETPTFTVIVVAVAAVIRVDLFATGSVDRG